MNGPKGYAAIGVALSCGGFVSDLHANQYCDGRSGITNKNLRTNGLYRIQSANTNPTVCFKDPYTDPVNQPFPAGVVAYFGNAGFDNIIGPGLNSWHDGRKIQVGGTLNF